MLVAVLTVVGSASMKAALTDLRIAGAHYKSVAVFHIAEAGLAHGRHEVSDEGRRAGLRRHPGAHDPLQRPRFPRRQLHGDGGPRHRRRSRPNPPPIVRVLSRGRPCARQNARASVEALLEHDPAGATPRERVRLVAWRALD